MKTIKDSQLVRVGNETNPAPKVGDRMTSKSGEVAHIVAVRAIGKPEKRFHLGMFYGLVQNYEIDIA